MAKYDRSVATEGAERSSLGVASASGGVQRASVVRGALVLMLGKLIDWVWGVITGVVLLAKDVVWGTEED